LLVVGEVASTLLLSILTLTLTFDSSAIYIAGKYFHIILGKHLQ